MVSIKRSIAALIVCFKPHVLLTLCILLVIAHSIVITIQRGTGNSWRFGKQHDPTVTTLVWVVAMIWAAFFTFIVRFELRNELDSLLVLFQCSKRGFRFMGVVGFHVALLALVALMVSSAVERSIPREAPEGAGAAFNNATLGSARQQFRGRLTESKGAHRSDTSETRHNLDADGEYASLEAAIAARRWRHSASGRLRVQPVPIVGDNQFETRKSKLDREYLLTVYKIWLTAIVYAFSYLVIENVIMFYSDMPLVEYVHDAFLTLIARVTGIDLSDYPAGEMLFNPLVRNRIR